MGHQVLKATYDGFTHMRSTVDIPKEYSCLYVISFWRLLTACFFRAEQFLKIRYPPYADAEEKAKIMAAGIYLDIPSDI